MTRVPIALAVLLLVAAPARAGYNEGAAAWKRGDYATALREWRPLADKGDARLQFYIGFMHAKGMGTPQDYAGALTWYRRAAALGDADALNNLGIMYDRGLGVPQDYAEAHKWYNLAASLGHKDAAANRDAVAKEMTPADISRAQKLAREWWAAWQKRQAAEKEKR